MSKDKKNNQNQADTQDDQTQDTLQAEGTTEETTEEQAVSEDINTDEAQTQDAGDTKEDVGSTEEVVDDEVMQEEVSSDSKPSEDDALGAKVKSHLGDDGTQKQTGERGWYVIHTYAGYEEQVADNLRQRIDTLKMSDKIFDVIVPKEKQIEIKNGKRKIVEKRIFPGYVIVDMTVNDYSWYVVRNTPNVTGFIGLGVRPTPMQQDEIDRIKKRMGVEEPKYKVNLSIDDLVRISDGPLKGFEGKITEVDEAKGKIKVAVNMFGRETPVNLDFLQVKKV